MVTGIEASSAVTTPPVPTAAVAARGAPIAAIVAAGRTEVAEGLAGLGLEGVFEAHRPDSTTAAAGAAATAAAALTAALGRGACRCTSGLQHVGTVTDGRQADLALLVDL